MRKVLALVTVLLTACGDGGAREEAFAEAAADDDRIHCAVGGAEQFRRECAVERLQGEEGLSLTIRAPDGGFRRLLVTKDGRGVIAADGAEPARVSIVGDGMIEVAVGSDRYRLPATVKGDQR